MASPRSLNDIGPGVMIVPRSGSWSVRFRLPRAIQERYSLPRLPRLITNNIRGNLSDLNRRTMALRREANRVGAKLDLLLQGHDAPGPGETLAHWLGLTESKRVRYNSKRRVPRSKTWQYLAQLYIDSFKAGTIAREINEADAIRRLGRIRDLDFCQDRFPPDIKAEEWDEYFDSLMRDRTTPDRGETTKLVLDTARFLIGVNGETNATEIAQHLNRKVKRQSVDKHISVLLRDGFFCQQMQAMREDLKRRVRALSRGPRFDEPFVLWAPTCSAKTVNKARALVRRFYDFGIRHRMFRDNPVLLTVKRTAGRRLSSKPCYRTKSMIEEELNRRRYSAQDAKRMYRYRVLDHAEQADLIRLAIERSDLQMLEPIICGLHGVAGVDVREMLKGGYNPQTGIISGQRAKTGQAKFSVPIAPALRPHLDCYAVKLSRGSFMFPHFRINEDGRECDPKGRMDRLFARLVRATEFDGLTFYCLRHSFISLMLSKGIPAEQITTWVGHLDIKLTTTTYAAFLPSESTRLMESLHLFEAVS